MPFLRQTYYTCVLTAVMVASTSGSAPTSAEPQAVSALMLLQKNARRQVEARLPASASVSKAAETSEDASALQNSAMDVDSTMPDTLSLLSKRSAFEARLKRSAADGDTVAPMDSSLKRKSGSAVTGRVEDDDSTPPTVISPADRVLAAPEEVKTHARNGNDPRTLNVNLRLYSKLLSLGRVAQTMSYKDLSQEGISKHDAQMARDRLDFASTLLSRLEEHHNLTAVELIDLVSAAHRHQSAETMWRNDALITASDFAQFVAFFRGEDFGTNFQHNATDSFFVTVQGDIESSRHEHDSAQNSFDRAVGSIWPRGVVNYCFARDTTARIRRVFLEAVQHYQALTPFLKFEQVAHLSSTDSADHSTKHSCDAEHAIVVTSDSNLGCFSSLGMTQQKTQQLNLHDPGCALVGTALHELGHALGMAHEHPRHMEDYTDDANAPGYVLETRIFGERRNHFRVDDSPLRLEAYMLGLHTVKDMIAKFHGGDASALYLQSDPLSIMHFDAFAFVGPYYQKRRMSLMRDAQPEQMGQRVGLSQSDITHLSRLYSKTTGSLTDQVPILRDNAACVDGYDSAMGKTASCPPLYSALPWCPASVRQLCCACGGGVHFQCSEGDAICALAKQKRTLYSREVIFGSLVYIFVATAVVIEFRRRSMCAKLDIMAATACIQGHKPIQHVGDYANPACQSEKQFQQVGDCVETETVGESSQPTRQTADDVETVGLAGKASNKAKATFKTWATWLSPAGTALNQSFMTKRPSKEAKSSSPRHSAREEASRPPASLTVHRMNCSDSSDNEARDSDPFEKPWCRESANEPDSDTDGGASAS
eukprot:TRINITY_DN23809_c1_g3_i2.p1 TRINITY_DN23809_c1_g3~~TRINITY_DN23809_c1_g3_i2.p1  ORF type:complete len:822 (+),score=70.97 TRINITY_DN23809_c1_g3_i2:65-2530(+)